jgi:hypothetical protein
VVGLRRHDKRHSKNDCKHHMTRPIHRRNTVTLSKMGPTIVVGSAKAQGSKAKSVYGLEPSRTTRARDEVTQRMANILAHPVPHQGDPASSCFISESRLGGDPGSTQS